MCLISRWDVPGGHGETALERAKSRIGFLGDELVHSLGVDELEADTLRSFEEGTSKRFDRGDVFLSERA
jgi:hypothetical protein